MPLLDDSFLSNMNFVCRLGGYFSAPPNSAWRLSLYRFEQNKFYYMTGGSCHICIRDTWYTAQPGDWFYIPAGLAHAYSSHKELPMAKFWMHFDLYPSNILSRIPELPVMVSVPEEKREAVEQVFREFSAAFHTPDLARGLKAKAAGIQLLSLYLELAFPENIQMLQAAPQELMSLLAYVHQNLFLPLTNADMAAILHLHPVYFCRWFRDRIGQSPQQYLLGCRLEAGKRLLEKTERPVTDIAHEVGFYDAAHFSHAFHRRYGASPTQYRTLSRIDYGFHPEKQEPL